MIRRQKTGNRLAACCLLAVAAIGAAPLTGCAMRNTRDDIISINKFWHQFPWIRNDNGQVVGLKAPVYFVSRATQKGVFVSEPIVVDVNRITYDESGETIRELVHREVFPPRRARDFRVAEPSVLGEHYGIVIRWPDTLDLSGEQIEVVFKYQRSDGRLIRDVGKRFIVPDSIRVSPPRTIGG